LPELNKPYRGWKLTFFEGGIHAPYFIRWPDKISAGSRYDSAVTHVDIFPTEQHNLDDSHPERLENLTQALYAMDNQMVESLWPELIEVPVAVDYAIDKKPFGDFETVIWSN